MHLRLIMCRYFAALVSGLGCVAVGGAQSPDWTATGGPSGSAALAGAISPTDGRAYVATSVGGFRSLDRGTTWVDRFGPPSNSLLVAAAFGNDALYVGALDGTLLRSADGGATWTTIPSPAPGMVPATIRVQGDQVYVVVIPPNPNQTGGDLWASQDRGQSWSLLATPMQVGLSLLIDGQNIFVEGAQLGSTILRSTDGGQNWTQLGGGSGASGLFSLGIGGIVKLGTTLYLGTGDGVFSSTDNGDHWTIGTGNAGYPFQVQNMVVLDGAAYATGFILSNGNPAIDYGPGVWRTTDGHTWTRADTGLPTSSAVWQRVELAAGSGTLFLIAPFGLYRSTDAGSHWTSADRTIPAGFVWTMAAAGDALLANPVNTDQVLGFMSAASGHGWTRSVALGIPSSAVSTVTLKLWARDQATVFAGTQTAGIFRSSDGGRTWTPVNNGVPTYNGTAGEQFREIQAFTRSGSWVFAASGVGLESAVGSQGFVFTGGGMLRSEDNGQSWQPINNGFPIIGQNVFSEPEFDPVLCAATSGTTILVGTFDLGVFRSSNDGGLWQEANTGLPRDQVGSLPRVNALVVRGAEVFVGLDAVGPDGGVYKSSDHGLTWQIASTGLPNIRVKALAEHRGVIYAGFGSTLFNNPLAGVYASSDAGGSWSRAGHSLDTLGVQDLVVVGDTLFAATPGFGVWELATNSCPADFNHDGTLSAQDIFDFLAAWFSGDPRADFNGNGLTVQDIFDFLAAWFAGCP